MQPVETEGEDEQLQLEGWWIFTPAATIPWWCNPRGRQGRGAPALSVLRSRLPPSTAPSGSPATPSVIAVLQPSLSSEKKKKLVSLPTQRCFFPGKIKSNKSTPQSPARCRWLPPPQAPPLPWPAGSRCSALPPPQNPLPPAAAPCESSLLPPAPPLRAAVGCRFPFHLEIFSGGRSRLVISARRKRHRRGSRGEAAGAAGHRSGQLGASAPLAASPPGDRPLGGASSRRRCPRGREASERAALSSPFLLHLPLPAEPAT
ncbi:protein enabled homolog [Myiozetetes cayanensis]|uniref:protein enabled homolog n=1 Tax=Myiozetetes cayanensis TaxID=478635 RepID=UPI0021607DB3|nr:protein enabled homolog [Myiozetetes cayanensis]